MVDMGTHAVKAGYAGEDTPKAVFPTPVGWISKDKLGDVEMKEAKSDKRSKSRGKKAVKENEEEEEDAEEKKKGEKSTKTPGINDDPTKTRRYYVDGPRAARQEGLGGPRGFVGGEHKGMSDEVLEGALNKAEQSPEQS